MFTADLPHDPLRPAHPLETLPIDAELGPEPTEPRREPGACVHQRQVIKQGTVFVVSHTDGAIHPGCSCGQGVYLADTRFVSGLTWHLEGQLPIALSSHAEQNFFSRTELVNEAFHLPDGRSVRRESVHLGVTRLVDGAVHERVQVSNFNPFPVRLRLALEMRADFLDMFEVRGFGARQRAGTFLLPELEAGAGVLRYLGTDTVLRETVIRFTREPDRLEARSLPASRETGLVATFALALQPGGCETLEFTLEPRVDGQGFDRREALELEFHHLERIQRQALGAMTDIRSTDRDVHQFIQRGMLDLTTLVSPMDSGPYLVAGTPWYACPFGRDGLIAAYQALMLAPGLAVGTLRYLARLQGSRLNPTIDEEPGKILHESRVGELSLTGEMPFAPSYCTVDATPLWLILLCETVRWTGDLELARELWPNALRALEWIDRYGDQDGDGFVEYRKQGENGLSNQGWKDSWDSIIHPDGAIAEAPIALAEVQGYVYDAKRRMAELAQCLGDPELAGRLAAEAATLKEAFNAAFWCEEGYYAIALDAHKQRVRSRTSNPGHGLWSGIIADERVPYVIQAMLDPSMFSGWGIRTMSAGSPNFNPISYHNGTIWPHDNAIIAKGMADQGDREGVEAIARGLFDAARHFEYYRLPELFCGFRRDGQFSRPIPYPVACSPQAWAAGTPALLLQSLLGIQPDGVKGTLLIHTPLLPAWMGDVTLTGLRVGRGSVDLSFSRIEGQTICRVLECRGEIQVQIAP